jgi:hypothetical protein
MIWFYERGGETLKIETRYNNARAVYELIWHHPDGTSTIEAFTSEALFLQRSQAVETSLSSDAWHLAGAPSFMADGWKKA